MLGFYRKEKQYTKHFFAISQKRKYKREKKEEDTFYVDKNISCNWHICCELMLSLLVFSYVDHNISKVKTKKMMVLFKHPQ
jgi:hypothetical protein